MDRPNLTDDTEREEFAETLSERVEAKRYPTCDPSVADDILLGLFVAEEASNRGMQQYSNRIRDIVYGPLEVGQSILEDVQRDDDPSTGGFRPERQSWLLSTQLWRDTLSSFRTTEDGVEYCGDIANDVVNATTYEDAAAAFSAFKEWFQSDVVSQFETEIGAAARLETDEASAQEVALYNGLLMLLHRREMGADFSDTELRSPS